MIHPLPPRSHNPGESWDRRPESRRTLQQRRHRWKRLLRAGRHRLRILRDTWKKKMRFICSAGTVNDWSDERGRGQVFLSHCFMSVCFLFMNFYFIPFASMDQLLASHSHPSPGKRAVLGQHSVFHSFVKCDHAFCMSFFVSAIQYISWLSSLVSSLWSMLC